MDIKSIHRLGILFFYYAALLNIFGFLAVNINKQYISSLYKDRENEVTI